VQFSCQFCSPYSSRLFDTNQSKNSRSRNAILSLRTLAARPPSAGRSASKRTEGDANLSPPAKRSGAQPTSPEGLRQQQTARILFGEATSQPHIVLGTPILSTQRSAQLFRPLAPSPPAHSTTRSIASHSDPTTCRSSATGFGRSYSTVKFHRGGKDSQDDSSKAVARAKQAVIQRDHRSRRRAGEAVSLTPTLSQLGTFERSDGHGEGIPLLWSWQFCSS